MTFMMDLLFVEIHVRVPDQIKSKQLKVNITSMTILVAAQIDREWKTILQGTLSGKCKATDAMWTITGQNKLNINIGLSIVIIQDCSPSRCIGNACFVLFKMVMFQTKWKKYGGKSYSKTKQLRLMLAKSIARDQSRNCQKRLKPISIKFNSINDND